MESGNSEFKPSRLQKTNILLKITFGWCRDIFSIGNKETLTTEHLDNVPTNATSEFLVKKLESEWERQQHEAMNGGPLPSIRWAIVRTFFPRIFLFNILGFIMETFKLLQSIMFGMFITLFADDSTTTTGMGLVYAVLLAAIIVIPDIIREPLTFYNKLFGRKIQVACCSLIYKKALKLNCATVPKNHPMVSNETGKFDTISTVFPYLWLGPFDCLLALLILVFYVDMFWRHVLLGYFIFVISFLPLQMLQRKMHNIYRKRAATTRKYRLSLLTEIFTAMRVIKMSVFEKSFSGIVKKNRKAELSSVLLSAIFHFIAMAITFFGHRLLEVVYLTIYFVTANQYLISDVFVIFSLMYLLRPSVLDFFPRALYLYLECLIGCDRIEEFMLLKEKNNASTDSMYTHSECEDDTRVVVNELCCSWENKGTQTLQNISVDINNGEIFGVVGTSGSGKSTFLMALLHEIPITSGDIQLYGTIAYVSQKPCIFPGTIRQNILFGKKYEEDRYLQVLEATALTKDIKRLPERDLSMACTSDTPLTDDQVARINLARAVYQDADIYLLDEPFKDVDATVAKYIFEKCIMGYLKKKTRVFATCHALYLREVDRIMVLKQGKLEVVGGYYDVRIIEEFISSFTYNCNEFPESRNGSLINSKGTKSALKDKISNKHYADYFYAGTNDFGLSVLVISLLITQVTYVLTDFWISHWANLEECFRHHFNYTTCNEERFLDPYSYATLDNTESTILFIVFIGVSSIMTVLYGILFFFITLNACRQLHETVFERVLRAPLLFFDSTLLDRILCRFISDMNTMEVELPKTMLSSIQIALFTCSIVIVNIIMSWYLLFVAIPIFASVWYVRSYTLKTTKDIKLLENKLRLPVDELVNRTFGGLTTIRSHHAQTNFIESFYNVQDSYSEAWLMDQATKGRIAVALYSIVNIFIVFILLGSIIGKNGLSVGLVGIVVGRSILLSQLVQTSVFTINDTETIMTSVKRVIEYTKLYSEAPLYIKSTKPSTSRPGEGAITFNNVFLSYSAESPIVLKNLSFMIHHREKVGILGRKGAGKSSIVAALFRLAEPTGTIFIDGDNISSLGLHDLRKKISIVPKDPVLFSTSLRANLDPFGEYNDVSLWEAMKKVRLDWYIRECTGKLDMAVGTEGNTFSVGQRQLIYLAKAILRRNNILIIEEPPKFDDQITTTIIQHILQNHFKKCTVLTITRRLNNIMDSDRIMVIDDGELSEFDSAYVLLQNRNSFVRHLLKEMNSFERKRLLGIATSHHTCVRN
ncbi:multidrug resistance-associated protein 4-like [Anneissia japonica]|uniref:multidrug resistance-associated protein 4-like n=1 Tax=Anneissia japonica TaxID=1529436 RepID=UPI0014259597|nr:multidrug resistance-associated protein 4-like [Anneissia japonica]